VKRLLFFLSIVFVSLLGVFDALLKSIAVRTLGDANHQSLSPIVDFALHKNPGIAFDIPLPFYIILPLTAAICGIFCYFLKKTWSTDEKIAVASAMIVIGALGNFLDRAINNFTTDYIILFKTSAINISDLLIVIGMIGFLWYHKSNPSERQIS
jgi:signal peptidase II